MNGDSPSDEVQPGNTSGHASSYSNGSLTPPDSGVTGNMDLSQAAAAVRTKRIACVICRRRKLRCDGMRPSCGNCSRLGHSCGYDEVRRKSGPKRGYVKQLEARLAQVETQLKSKNHSVRARSRANSAVVPPVGISLDSLEGGASMGDHDMMSGFMNSASSGLQTPGVVPDVLITSEPNASGDVDFPWEMIGLGLEEPLPPQDMIDELHQIYFDKLHPSAPMIHKYRYLAAMNLAPHMRPAICLRYIMWALACSITDKYMNYSEVFYQRARKYAESDEMKGHGQAFITVGHTQCWCLITMFEFKMLYFPRAWMSSGRASRLALMLGLHRQDGTGLEVKQVLPPPRDWTDKEERRRTFWVTFCNDRYASIGTGWPMTIDEEDIMTNLPASGEAYDKSKAEPTATLADALNAQGTATLSSFAGVVLVACLFGRNLTHLHRSGASDRPEDEQGAFWKRHRALDNILMTMSLCLPDHLRLPAGSKDANVVFLNMSIHSATICLHQAAILKAEKHDMRDTLIRDSTDRCFLAANEIVSVMKLVSHIDLAHMNPFISFCLYVAARIFIHAYKKRPEDERIRSCLDFLLVAMQAHRRKNNLTESFLIQLIVELDAAGLEHKADGRNGQRSLKSPEELQALAESLECTPIFQKQSQTQPSYHEVHARTSQSPLSVTPPPPPYQATPPQQQQQQPQPQQQQYNQFAVPTRERRSSLLNPNSNNSPINGMPMTQKQTWADKGYVRVSDGVPNNQNKVYAPRYDVMDAETSPSGHSAHENVVLTPSHSSRQSYSPQMQNNDAQLPGGGTLNGGAQELEGGGPLGGAGPYYTQSNQFAGIYQTSASGFTGQDQTPASAAAIAAGNNAFAMGTDWDMSDPSWSHVLEGIGWEDQHSLQPEMADWRPVQSNVSGNATR